MNYIRVRITSRRYQFFSFSRETFDISTISVQKKNVIFIVSLKHHRTCRHTIEMICKARESSLSGGRGRGSITIYAFRSAPPHRHELTKLESSLSRCENWPDLSSVSDLGLSTSEYWLGIGTSFAHYTIQLRGTDCDTATITVLLSTRLALFGDNAFLWAPGAATGQSRSFLDSSTVTVSQLLNRSPLFMRICGVLISRSSRPVEIKPFS